MSLTKPIPKKLREEMASDKFYSKCCITGLSNNAVKIDYHHNLQYAGERVNEKFCILPIADFVHRNIVKYKAKCNWIMLNRASESDLKRFSKARDYVKMKDTLNEIYGTYNDTFKH